MSENKQSGAAPPKAPSAPADPFAAWRDWLSTAERQLNSFFNDIMGTEEFTRAMNQFNEFTLRARREASERIGRFQAAGAPPSRDELETLLPRLSAIEERLAQLESKLGIAPSTDGARNANGPAPRPPRTKRPSTASKP